MASNGEQLEWRVVPMPIHGWAIQDSGGKEVIKDIYAKILAQQIVREHNAITFAIRSGMNWTLQDWQNWRNHHALAEKES